MERYNETQSLKPKRKSKRKKRLVILFIIILIAAGAGAYYWRDKQAKTEEDKKAAEIAALNDNVKTLEKQLADEKAKREESEKSVKTQNAKTIESIKLAINSGNTAALQSHMAPKIKVILAASEGMGDRTPAQAVQDLKYIDNAADPWDFALPETTLSSYEEGSYSEYFPEGALVGKSADNYVVSFTFGDNGKISGIFMASDASLLL